MAAAFDPTGDRADARSQVGGGSRANGYDLRAAALVAAAQVDAADGDGHYGDGDGRGRGESAEDGPAEEAGQPAALLEAAFEVAEVAARSGVL